MADHDRGAALFIQVAGIIMSRSSCPSCDCIGLAKAIGTLLKGTPEHLRQRILSAVLDEILPAQPAPDANAVRPEGEAVH